MGEIMKTYGWTKNRTRDPCNSSQELNHWAIQANIHDPYSPNYYTDLKRAYPMEIQQLQEILLVNDFKKKRAFNMEVQQL